MRRSLASKMVFFILIIALLSFILLLAKKIVLISAEKKILRAMQSANYCVKNDDCALVMFPCPFACGAYINKEKMADINAMVLGYFKLKPKRCTRDCAMPVTPVCQEGACAPRECVVAKKYPVSFPDNCLCPPQTVYTLKSLPSGEKVFECGNGKR